MEQYDQQTLPLDRFVGNYFRLHTSLGSKDRAEVAETVYAMVRWRGLLDEICGNLASWEQRLEAFNHPNFSSHKENVKYPPHIRVSFPKQLFDELCNCYGEEKAIDICAISNTVAPTTVRINTMKTTREQMLQRFQESYTVTPCSFAPHGIVFSKRINFSQMPEFKEGLFEIQDEGSQMLAQLVKALPGQRVMDYCAGAGGKTLAFAPQMNNTGQIYIHDIRKIALEDCKKRLKRAGIQNAQIVHAESDKLKKLKKHFDWVLVDAPCSGIGTLRRNPDMKWNYSEEMVVRLLGQQRMIFEKALSFLKPSGYIVYATCSLLNRENEDQIAHFMKTYELELVEEPFKSIPILNGMDGFFGAILRRK